MADATETSASTSTEVPLGKGESRAALLDSPVALVEDYRRARHETTGQGFCASMQVCFPYRGLGVWHVCGEDVVADATQVLFVRGGEARRLTGPVPGGYGWLILTPDVEIMSEIARASRATLRGHPLFRARRAPATPSLQAFRERFRSWATSRSAPDDLEGDETVAALLRAALQQHDLESGRCGPATARLIRRTKEFLAEHLSRPIRLLDVGRAVGASPAYLTGVFRRVEGVPLHRYLVQLRLARALPELAHADDLAALGLRVGFSSHSHFTAAFRRAFGCTPSRFRAGARTARVENS